jgi:hypothetical protein
MNCPSSEIRPPKSEIKKMIRFIFYAFLLYMAYKLVIGLIIPVYRTTRKVKRGFREMQERMQQQADQYNTQPSNNTTSPKPNQVGDYIDFEEVK